MWKRVTVSEARAKFFDLVDYVTDHPDSAVVIEHRSRKDRAVLVDEGRLKYLESIEVEYKRKSKPFKLLGSLKLAVPEDEFDAWFEENRRKQADLSRAKLADL
jgi:PHD/YefM family antitoxin component YafN of YafNO toxin-antitoxin module